MKALGHVPSGYSKANSPSLNKNQHQEEARRWLFTLGESPVFATEQENLQDDRDIGGPICLETGVPLGEDIFLNRAKAPVCFRNPALDREVVRKFPVQIEPEIAERFHNRDTRTVEKGESRKRKHHRTHRRRRRTRIRCHEQHKSDPAFTKSLLVRNTGESQA